MTDFVGYRIALYRQQAKVENIVLNVHVCLAAIVQ